MTCMAFNISMLKGKLVIVLALNNHKFNIVIITYIISVTIRIVEERMNVRY
jgi:hypothetical protein